MKLFRGSNSNCSTHSWPDVLMSQRPRNAVHNGRTVESDMQHRPGTVSIEEKHELVEPVIALLVACSACACRGRVIVTATVALAIDRKRYCSTHIGHSLTL